MKKTTASALLTLLFFCLNAQNTNILGEWTMRNMFKTKPEIIELGAVRSDIRFFENGKASGSISMVKADGDWALKDSILTIAGKNYQVRMLTDSALLLEYNAEKENFLMLYAKGMHSLKAQNDFDSYFLKNHGIKISWEELYKVVETMPTLMECGELNEYQERRSCHEEKLSDFISKNLIYPTEAKSKKCEGTVYVKFIVEKDGTITNAEILRSIGHGCDEEALRLIKTMPKWSPGKQRGTPVRVSSMQPIKFSLKNQDKKN